MPSLRNVLVERVAVVGTVADEVLRLGFDHVEVEAQLDQAHFVMVRGVRTDRERQAVAIHDRHDFHAFSTLRRSDLGASALRHHEGCVDEAFFFVEHAAFTQFVGNVHENAAQNFTAAPGLKAAMHRFVVRIALRQHVPLRAGVEYPQRPLQAPGVSEPACVQAARPQCSLPESDAESAPTANRLAESFHTYSGSTALGNFEIGSKK